MNDSNLLNAYFSECGYTKEEINELLESNPFGGDYMRWEKQKVKDNRYFASTIKKIGLLNSDIVLYEVGLDKSFRVSKSFMNEQYFYEASDVNPTVYIPNNGMLIINGKFLGYASLINKLKLTNKRFAVGISTIDKDYYEDVKKYYKSLSVKFNIPSFENENYDSQKIYMLYNKTFLR